MAVNITVVHGIVAVIDVVAINITVAHVLFWSQNGIIFVKIPRVSRHKGEQFERFLKPLDNILP